MDDVACAAALALAVVFLWAGAAKLLRPALTATSFFALGVPAAGASARVVPVVEIALAAALVVAPDVAAWAALALLGAFTVFVVRAIATGVTAPCSCFGAARAEPVSSVDAVRNAMIAALAVVATGAPRPRRWPDAPAIVAVAASIALGWAVLATLASRRRAREST